MKKIIKLVFIVLMLFVCLAVCDFMRAVQTNNITKPIITIKEEVKEGISNAGMRYIVRVYYGIGYSIQYYKDYNSAGNTATFNLFNMISLFLWEVQ